MRVGFFARAPSSPSTSPPARRGGRTGPPPTPGRLLPRSREDPPHDSAYLILEVATPESEQLGLRFGSHPGSDAGHRSRGLPRVSHARHALFGRHRVRHRRLLRGRHLYFRVPHRRGLHGRHSMQRTRALRCERGRRRASGCPPRRGSRRLPYGRRLRRWPLLQWCRGVPPGIIAARLRCGPPSLRHRCDLRRKRGRMPHDLRRGR